MPQGWRDWRIVLRALRRLGVEVYHEDEKYLFVARHPRRGPAIRKWWLPRAFEARLVQQLHLEWGEYAKAILAIEAEDRGEDLVPAPTVPSDAESIHSRELKRGLEYLRQKCEQAAKEGDATVQVSLDDGVDVTAFLREARAHPDELHLMIEMQAHAVMRKHAALEQVQLVLPTLEPFIVGRPGYDD
jgi:hypothetical protein